MVGAADLRQQLAETAEFVPWLAAAFQALVVIDRLVAAYVEVSAFERREVIAHIGRITRDYKRNLCRRNFCSCRRCSGS